MEVAPRQGHWEAYRLTGLDLTDVAELARTLCASSGAAIYIGDGEALAVAGAPPPPHGDSVLRVEVPATAGVAPAALCVGPATATPERLALLDRLAAHAALLLTGELRRLSRASNDAPVDELTGLPLRRELETELASALERAAREGLQVAVIYVDVDGFKVVNDTLGHAAGDEVLRHTANAMRTALRPEDVVARVGGDEFVAICEGVAGRDAACVLAERLAVGVPATITVEGSELFVSISVGVAVGAAPATVEEAMRDADTAMYEAKRSDGGTVVAFDEPMRARAARRRAVAGRLRHALERHELELAYQPIVSVAEERPILAEALLRWRAGPNRQLPPSAFLEVAERTRLIVPIGHWAIAQACADAATWVGQYPQPVCVTVNLSARQLRDPGLIPAVRDALSTSGLPSELLVLEVTESELVSSGGPAEKALTELREMGVGLALDDFGTGYSSLSYLSRLPFNYLKLDRSFVQQLAGDTRRSTIVMAVTQMARLLGMKVVAEGVEAESALRQLKAFRCDLAQGFLFGHPMPAASMAPLLPQRGLRAAAAA